MAISKLLLAAVKDKAAHLGYGAGSKRRVRRHDWSASGPDLIQAGQRDPAEAAGLADMDATVEPIGKQIGGFEEIQTSVRTDVSDCEKILRRGDLMTQEIERRLQMLQQHVGRLRAAGGEA